MNNIRKQYLNLKRQELDLEELVGRKVEGVYDEYQEQFEEISDELELLKKECPHENVKFYADAAGGSDSHYECQDCLKWSYSRKGLNISD